MKRDLRTTLATRFVAEIKATDGGGRVSNPNAFRTITVDHNNYAPQFPDDSCDRTVSATGVGTVVRLQATDADRGKLRPLFNSFSAPRCVDSLSTLWSCNRNLKVTPGLKYLCVLHLTHKHLHKY